MGLAFLAAPYWEIVYWIEVEMAEQHIAVLYNLTDFHNYGTLKKEIIRDQLHGGRHKGQLSIRTPIVEC